MNDSANSQPPSQASTVVIGGGVLGCSTLYHLAKEGVTDAILLERNKLTSGTTWHSAAQVRQLRSTRNLTRLIQYSAKLYQSLEAETGQSTGWISKGSLSIAATPDRMQHVLQQAALAKAYGVDIEQVSRQDIQSLWPLVNDEDLIGAVFSPDDGRVNPSDLCLSLTKGARRCGARIYEDTSVINIEVKNHRVTGVETAAGFVRAETVVICAGLWSRQLAAMADVALPIVPCHHYYLLTQPIAGIDGHLPTLSDHDSHLYIRDDVGGLLVGCFEPGAVAIDPSTLPEDFAFSLLPEDWDHFEPMMRNAMHRIPALEQAQVRTLLNGPESFSHDGSFFLGETQQVQGLHFGCGMNSVGVATGGGAGWALAHWIVNGEPPFHLGDSDPDRSHPVENQLDTLMQRGAEVLGRHYEIHYPGAQMHSARNLRLPPLHDRWIAENAHFIQVAGFERPAYFAALQPPNLTFARPTWFDQVGNEVRAAHNHTAIFDQSTFGKIRVRGKDAESFLQRMCANDMARAPGRVIYTAMLNHRGGYQSDLTALRINEDDYLLYTGTSALLRDIGWLLKHLTHDESVILEDVTSDIAVLGLMGPAADQALSTLGAGDVNDLGYFDHGEDRIAGIRVRAARISYVGEAGWELSCASNDAANLYDVLRAQGATPAGLYAQTSMRIEKGFLAMGHELDSDVTPNEADLEFAVHESSEFIGREAFLKRREEGPLQRIVSIVLDSTDSYPMGNEPIYVNEVCAGQATSAAFGYRVQKPVALGYMDMTHVSSLSAAGTLPVTLDIGSKHISGNAQIGAVFDPDGRRMKRQ